MADKQKVIDLENSIFPIINNIIDTTKFFQKEIEMCKSS